MRKAVMWSLPLLAAGLASVGIASSGSIAFAGAVDPLSGALWKARPLVVVADQPADPLFQKQIIALEARRRALADYDIKLVAVTGESAALRHKLGLSATGFAVALVGKDGGVKETWRGTVDPDRIFTLIDRMPMRRDEVRRRKSD